MPGNRIGGLKAAKKNIETYGKDFYRILGSKGGKKSAKKGFALDPQRARLAGAKGGRISRRTGVANGTGKTSKPKEYLWPGEEDEELTFEPIRK